MKDRAAKKSQDDIEFLKMNEARSLRMHLEFLKPYIIQKNAGIKNTVVVFGSSRFYSQAQAKAALARVTRELRRHPKSKKQQDTVHGSSPCWF